MSADEDKPKGTAYGLGHVGLAVLVFYLLLILFDARGLHHWSLRLSVSAQTESLQKLTGRLWSRTADLGLEAPKIAIETLFLNFQGAHALLYPKGYAEYAESKRIKSEKRAELAEKRRRRRAAELELKAKQLAELKGSVARGPRVLLVGDSIMAAIGPIIKRDVASKLQGVAFLDAKISTGLARPDVFDWPAEVRDLTQLARFDYVVIMLGTNDSQDFSERGHILNYGTEEWVKSYNRRLASLMSATCRRVKKAFWVSLPPMQSEAFQRKIFRINSWAKRQAQGFPCMNYVDISPFIGDEEGQYTSYRESEGHLSKVRTSDGIHITAGGGAIVSEVLMEFMTRGSVVSAH